MISDIRIYLGSAHLSLDIFLLNYIEKGKISLYSVEMSLIIVDLPTKRLVACGGSLPLVSRLLIARLFLITFE